MRKILYTICFLLLVSGCSNQMFGGDLKDWEKAGSTLKLKCDSSKILESREVDNADKTGKIISYDCISDVKTAKNIEYAENDLYSNTELVEKKDGKTTRNFWGGDMFYKGSDGNYEIIIEATTTINAFDEQKNTPIARIKSFFINYANAADYQSNSANKKIRYSGTVWSTVRSAVTGNTPEAGTVLEAQATKISTTYYIDRYFATHDTSAIPDDEVALSSSYNITVTDKSASNPSIDIVPGSQADTTIANTDFDSFTLTRLANTIDITATGAYSFTLNAAGLSNVNVSGYTKVVLIDKKDFDDTTPSAYIYPYIASFTNATAGYRPYITITSGTPPAPAPSGNIPEILFFN